MSRALRIADVVSFVETAFKMAMIFALTPGLTSADHILGCEIVLGVGKDQEVLGDDLRRSGEHLPPAPEPFRRSVKVTVLDSSGRLNPLNTSPWFFCSPGSPS